MSSMDVSFYRLTYLFPNMKCAPIVAAAIYIQVNKKTVLFNSECALYNVLIIIISILTQYFF